MSIRLNSTNKVVCALLLALCLFASCKEPAGPGYLDNSGDLVDVDDGDDGDGEYNNPNAGTTRKLTFSHGSGLYAEPFSLSITAAPGSAIYYSIDGSLPSPAKVDNKVVFKYASPITVQNRNGQANILATPENSRQLYGEPGDRGNNMPTAYIPTNAQVPKATVIRAIAVDAGGKQSGVLTKTYFIGNNLANYANHCIISLITDPYNLIDQDYGIMVRGNPNNRWDGPNVYNFQKKGEDWEREAYMELFEGNVNSRSVPLSAGVGIRVRGGWSRAPGQKSFNVYFKEQYGINNLKNYNLIPGAVKADGKTPVEIYKSFMLRNGANDIEYTKFYDVFLQDLVSDRSFTAQAGAPCIVYLNGEYWGPYNLQERYSDNHTEYKYGVRKENVISYDNGELDDGVAGEEALFRDMIDKGTKDMSDPANYQAFCEAFDIENFVDYWAAQIYIYNEDWPHNNYRLWRTRNAEPGNPYGDKKWRWQMFDTEFAMGIYSGGRLTGQSGIDAFVKIFNGNHHNNQLFKALLANEDFCRRFVNTMMDLYNVNFHPDSCLPKLNNYAAAHKPLMDDYFTRWGGGSSSFQNKVNDARDYLNNIRDAMVYHYLPTYFGGYSGIANIGISGGNLRDVTLSAIGGSGASIKINTVTPSLASGSWTGKYYSGNPITVTASAPPSGYAFDGWMVSGGSAVTPSALTTTVNLTGNAQITAKYRQIGAVVVDAISITLNKTILELENGITSFNLTATVFPSNATYKTVYWESSDYDVANVDSSGKVTAVRTGTATITASTTTNGVYATCAVTVEYDPVLVDLAAKLQTLPAGTISDGSDFNTKFGSILSPGGAIDNDAAYTIIDEGGIKKLQVDEFAMWGVGVDIKDLKAGDIIEIKGTYLGGPSNGIQIIIKRNGNWDYGNTLRRWNLSSGQNFEDIINMTENGDIRIRTHGVSPWVGPGGDGYIPDYVDSFVIERLKVIR
jgi:uncharacterized protein YjdB